MLRRATSRLSSGDTTPTREGERVPWPNRPSSPNSTAAGADGEDMSGDILDWLGRQEHAREQGRTLLSERVDHSWVLVFAAHTTGGQKRVFTNMQEAWNICRRFADFGLRIEYAPSNDGARLYIKVGAENLTVMEEAQEQALPMRMTKTRGMTPFERDHAESYVVAMNGGYFNSAQRQQLVRSRMKRSLLLSLPEQQALGTADKQLSVLQQRLMDRRPIRAEHLRTLLASCGAFRDHIGEVMGPLVEKAVNQTRLLPFFSVNPPEDKITVDPFDPLGTLADVGDEVFRSTKDVLNKAGKWVMGKKRVLVGKDEMERRMRKRMLELGLQPLTYQDCLDLADDIGAWLKGRGRTENFTGTLVAFFPTHDEDELQIFKTRWANLNLITNYRRFFIMAKDNEGKSTEGAYYADDPSIVSGQQRKQISFAYQPIDEIRDYFGDPAALYFCWLGAYVKALIIPSAVGIFAMLVNAIRGEYSPDTNPLTIFYSFFFACWSVAFLASWERRENELHFLWGTENLSVSQQPRPQYKGLLRVNFTTSREVLVDKSPVSQLAKQACSWLVISLFMLLTATGALLAELVSKYAEKRDINSCVPVDVNASQSTVRICDGGSWSRLSCDNAGADCIFNWEQDPIDSINDVSRFYGWIVLSSVLNLIVMMVAGVIFTPLASRLNDWENHKLQSTYDNHLVIKTFAFQFVNNCEFTVAFGFFPAC